MAISRSKKETLVAELSDILSSAKMVVLAEYNGVGVSDLEILRREARKNNVTIKVVKNRLMRVAMEQSENFKSADMSGLSGQVLYAISDDDEVLPAKVLADFAKKVPELKLAGAFNDLGRSLSVEEAVELSKLPTKDQLIAETIAQLLSPVNDVTNALSGYLHALLDGVSDKASA